MKKILFTVLLLVCVCFKPVFSDTVDDYTIMIYMNGSTLESTYNYMKKEFKGNATKDLQEMIEGYKGDENINIVVQTIGTKRWDNDYVESNVSQRFLLTTEGFEEKDRMPKQNVGYKKGLSDFITWSVRNYPADKYGLILWNHGGGPVKGFGLDEHFNGDVLHLEELNAALETAKKTTDATFEFIGFDACLMASLEVADTVAPYANFLLASQELEPTHGWNYRQLLKELHIDPTMKGDVLGKIVADGYLAEADEKGESYNITFSVVDLSKVDAIINELGLLVESTQPIFKTRTNFYDYAKAVAASRTFGGNSRARGYTDLIDIVDFCYQLTKNLSLSTDRLSKAVEEAVVYKIDGHHSENTSGLSLYFPLKDKENIEKNLKQYKKTGFSSTYLDFVENFQQHMTALIGEDKIEYDLNGPNKKSDFYHIVFDEEDLDKIAKVYLEVFLSFEDDKYPHHSFKSLGYNNDIFFDADDGIYYEQFDREWIHLDSEPLLVRLMEETDTTIQYEATVLYNDQEMYLLFTYDKESQTYTIHGLRRGMNPVTRKPDKEIYQLKAGDTIQPMYKALNNKRRQFEWIQGNKITMTGDSRIEIKDIESEYFALSFRYYDYSYRAFKTAFFKFER